MPELRHRSYQLELLDGEHISKKELWQNLKELEVINQLLGGYAPLLKGLNTIELTSSPLKIVDIGCGGGDSLRRVSDWAKKNNISVELSGVDLKEECLNYARVHSSDYEINWICSDYQKLDTQWDIVMSSLFCHHLDEQQLLTYLRWAKLHSRHCVLINDLHRHPLAYYGIQWLTKLLSKSHLVKHDAPLSVWRGFTRPELEKALIKCQFQFDIKWVWAFRYLVIGYV